MKEVRSFDQIEFRIAPETRKIEGYALLFNKKSQDLGGFYEIISPEAINGVLERSDVFALLNHEEDKVLARNTYGKGTLTLNVDENGLKYSFSAPKTPLGDEVYDAINRGDLRNSSFAFTIADGGQKWERSGDKYVRTITQFDKLFDVSPCWTPAYPDTSVATRSLSEFKKENINMDIEEREVKIEVSIELDEQKEPEMMPTTTEAPDMPDMMDETVEEDAIEMIEVIYNGNSYNVPKRLLEDIINETDQLRKLDEYFNEIEISIDQLKN